MRKLTVVQNPSVLSISVRYRNKKGQYTKPHLASVIEFKPPRARKVVRIELPKGRKTKKIVEELTKKAVYAEVARREAPRIAKEEKERAALPLAKRGDLPDPGKISHKRRVMELYSKKLEEEVLMIGHNFTFGKKIPVYPGNYDSLSEYLKEMITKVAGEIMSKEKAWGEMFYVKLFGDGYYNRRITRERGKKKIVPDRLGFSIDRARVMNKEQIEDHIEQLFMIMRDSFFGHKGRGGYFSKKVNSNEYFFTGFRIEHVISKG